MVLLNSKREARMLPGVVGAPGLERGRQSKGCGSRGVPGACHRPGHTEVPGQPREISPRDGRPPKRDPSFLTLMLCSGEAAPGRP